MVSASAIPKDAHVDGERKRYQLVWRFRPVPTVARRSISRFALGMSPFAAADPSIAQIYSLGIIC
jgi:hypothetical protein